MKITLVQLNSNDDIAQNVKAIKDIILQHIKLQNVKDQRLFILPENSLFFRVKEGDSLKPLSLNSSPVLELWEFCQENKVKLHFTTAIQTSTGVVNGSVLLEANHEPRLLYSKVHLFDIHLQGQAPIKESDFFQYGSDVTNFVLDDVKFGSSICYDLRFSELYAKHAQKAVDVILVPAAFLVKTGQAHWEVLLRARAIESQAYVLAPAQGGEHRSKDGSSIRHTYGHTLAVDPWGVVLGVMSDNEVGCLDVEIDLEKIKSVRRQIPMSHHRRL